MLIWLAAMLMVAGLVAAVALSGVRIRGGRPAGRTRLMSAARLVLVILAAAAAYAVWSGS